MYRLLTLPRKVLITPDEVFAQTAIDNTADPRIIWAAIQIAEERFVRPALGSAFYNDFRTKKNVVVDSINKSFLQDAFDYQNGSGAEPVLLEVGQIVNALELIDSQWYVDLWNEHLWKYISECVVYIASPSNYSRFTASGELVNNPRNISLGGEGTAGAQSVSLAEMKWKLDKMLQDRIDPLLTPMKEWIYEYSGHFPLYPLPVTSTCSGLTPEKPGRKTPWIHGIYSDSRGGCCDE